MILTWPVPEFCMEYGVWKLAEPLSAFTVFAMRKRSTPSEVSDRNIAKMPLTFTFSSAPGGLRPPDPWSLKIFYAFVNWSYNFLTMSVSFSIFLRSWLWEAWSRCAWTIISADAVFGFVKWAYCINYCRSALYHKLNSFMCVLCCVMKVPWILVFSKSWNNTVLLVTIRI